MPTIQRNTPSAAPKTPANVGTDTRPATAVPGQADPGQAATATTTERDAARVLGLSTTPQAPARAIDGVPRNIDEAFDNLLASSSGKARVRRFADDNVLAWNNVLDLVRKADKTIDFSFFTIEKDPYGHAYLGGLLHQQMRGVQVTGLTDWNANARGRGFVGYGVGLDVLQELAAYGAKIKVFNTPGERVEGVAEHGLTWGTVGSNHDKILVVDKNTDHAEGETGGRNIAGAYHQDPKDNPAAWRDDTLHIVGKDAVQGLAVAVDREMKSPAADSVRADEINLDSQARGMLLAYAMMEEWVARPSLSEADKATLKKSPNAATIHAERLVDDGNARLARMIAALPANVRQSIPASLTPGELDDALQIAQELVKDTELCGSRALYEQHDGFMDGDVKIIDQTGAASAAPGERYNEIAPDLLHLMKGAQREILIQNPYVVLTEEMVKAFEGAARRGVKITIVTNSPESTDSAVTQGFFLNDWPSLEARIPTLRIHVATGERKFHAKCFTIDDKVSGDMTYNADLLSGLVNSEVGAITRSEASARNLKASIEADLRNPANGFKEWTIKKDALGRAVLDAKGKPVVIHGPKEDVSAKLQRIYTPIQLLCRWFTTTGPGKSLAHPELDG